jgi:hypothetical protein
MMRTGESDPGRKVLCTEPGGIRDRKRGRPKLVWCGELERTSDGLEVEIGASLPSQERNSGSSFRRPSPTQGCSRSTWEEEELFRRIRYILLVC